MQSMIHAIQQRNPAWPLWCADKLSAATALRPRAVRRRHCVGGGGAPANFGRRRRGPKKSAAAARRGVGGQKTVFSKIHEKISFYPQNFLRNFFSHQSFEVCNASGQLVRPAKNDGSIDYGVSELQHENKY